MTGVVDYETNSVYQLMVSARDRGPDPVSSDTMVTIRVQDANDNAPRIIINTLLSSNTNVAPGSRGRKRRHIRRPRHREGPGQRGEWSVQLYDGQRIRWSLPVAQYVRN